MTRISKNIIYVRCRSDVPGAYREIVKAIGGQAHLFWKAIPQEESVTLYEPTERDLRVRSGLKGCLDLAVPEGSKVYNSVARLLAATNPANELGPMEMEFKQ